MDYEVKQGEKILFAEERKRQLVDYINENRRVTVPQLCKDFSVSSATIRNDLRELDETGLITRTHGGAIRKTKTRKEIIIDNRTCGSEYKKKIAELSLSFIDEGDTILIDSGTTTMELAKLLLGKKNLTVITNDLNIACLLDVEENIDVVMIGGILRKGFHCTINHGTDSILNVISVDKAFIGTNSFSFKKGASTPNLSQAEMKKKMISVASKVIILCDHTKLETNSFMAFATIDEIDLLITDKISSELRNKYENVDIQVCSCQKQ